MDNIEARPLDKALLRCTALRIVKNVSGIFGMPQIQFDADFYCRKMEDPKYYYETGLEYVIYVEHLELVDACLVQARLQKDSRWKVQDVLCEGKHILYEENDEYYIFTFEISGFSGKTRTLYIHTLLKEPGLTLRIEQNDPDRCAGLYRNEPYPEIQICSAQHFVFAMREVLHHLHVPQYLSESGLGYILLLGFETNNEVHGDYPPHWHMIYRWPNYCGSQAPHIYIDNTGKMTHNLMCIDQIPLVRHDYQPEEWCAMVDMYGREILRCKINLDGGMSVYRDGFPLYSISPYSDKGISIFCEGKKIGLITVQNDARKGNLVITGTNINEASWQEEIVYDPMIGTIFSHKKQREITA